MVRAVALLQLLLLGAVAAETRGVSTRQEQQAVNLAHGILADEQTVPKLVRLAFHACFGDGCNGCINMDDPHNAGLGEIVTLLNERYELLRAIVQDEPVMSRADWWAVAEIEAARMAAAGNGGLDLTLRFGREDCPTSPRSSALHDYPNPSLNMEENMAKFGPGSRFHLPREEVIALIGGGHSLGGMHREFSGYGTGSWDRTPLALDSDFFQLLTEIKWTQVEMPNGNWLWQAEEAASADPIFMLNTDMALINVISGHNTSTGKMVGECPTEYEDCPFDVLNAPIAVDFAKDESKLLRAFASAYQKLVDNSASLLVPAQEAAIITGDPWLGTGGDLAGLFPTMFAIGAFAGILGGLMVHCCARDAAVRDHTRDKVLYGPVDVA